MATLKKEQNLSSSYNPAFVEAFPDWTVMEDTNAGERQIKEATTAYLPKTEGQKNDKNNGKTRYANYVLRANFFNYVSDTAVSMLGVMYSEKPTEVKLPSRIEGMAQKATPAGDTLLDVARRLNHEQIVFGRRGLLLDVPTGEGAEINPYFVEYDWNNIINWNTALIGGEQILQFVVLDESGNVFNMEKNEWEYVESYRLLALDAAGLYYSTMLDDKDLKGIDIKNPTPVIVDGEEIDLYPSINGTKLEYIPFAFVNTTNTDACVEKPPLLPLANKCVAIYRGDADYRQALFMQGQDTLFGKGMNPNTPLAIGAGAATITENKDADMKYVGVNSNGLPEMEKAQQNLHAQAMNAGISLIDQSQQESGEALKTRLAIKTASMKTITTTGAVALTKLLRISAEWTGANPDEVSYIPNLDFSSSAATAQEALQLWTGIQQGMPLSIESYHEWLRQNDFTTKSFDEESEEIENQQPLI